MSLCTCQRCGHITEASAEAETRKEISFYYCLRHLDGHHSISPAGLSAGRNNCVRSKAAGVPPLPALCVHSIAFSSDVGTPGAPPRHLVFYTQAPWRMENLYKFPPAPIPPPLPSTPGLKDQARFRPRRTTGAERGGGEFVGACIAAAGGMNYKIAINAVCHNEIHARDAGLIRKRPRFLRNLEFWLK
jgi:hypothetical protein